MPPQVWAGPVHTTGYCSDDKVALYSKAKGMFLNVIKVPNQLNLI